MFPMKYLGLSEIPLDTSSPIIRKQARLSRPMIERNISRLIRSLLPSDAKHNGYRRVIRQNIKFKTDNVEYWLKRYYSPSRIS